MPYVLTLVFWNNVQEAHQTHVCNCVCEELLNGFRHNCKLCKYTNENYFFLFGTAPDGRWWTLVAQPYPTKLCNVVARCLVDRVTASPVRARELW